MRKWMYEAVKSCDGQTEFSADRIMTTGAVEGPEGDGDSPARPFIVIRAATNQPPLQLGSASKIKQQRYQIWLHREPGSMLDIDDFCKSLEDGIPAMAPDNSSEWVPDVIMEARWEDTSGDGYDDHFKTTTRFVTFLVTYNPA